MSDLPREVHIVEEGPREGFQADTRIFPLDAKLELINCLSETGVKKIVLTSLVNPKRVPAMADAEQLIAKYRRAPGVAYTALWLNSRGLERAIASGRLDISGILSLCGSEAFLERNQQRSAAEDVIAQRQAAAFYRERGIALETVGIFAAFGCNFEGRIAPESVVAKIDMLIEIAKDEGASPKRVALADTMGWANPAGVQRLVGMVRDRHPDLTISLHLHNTRGLGLANAYAGLQLGVVEFDSAVGGIGGCPFSGPNAAGNICTEDLAFMCEEMGISTRIDLEKMVECARLAERIFERPLPGALMKAGTLSALGAGVRA